MQGQATAPRGPVVRGWDYQLRWAVSAGQTTQMQTAPYAARRVLGLQSTASHSKSCLIANPTSRTTKLRGRSNAKLMAFSPNHVAGTLQPSAVTPWITEISGQLSNSNQEMHWPATIKTAPKTPRTLNANASLVRRATAAFLRRARIRSCIEYGCKRDEEHCRQNWAIKRSAWPANTGSSPSPPRQGCAGPSTTSKRRLGQLDAKCSLGHSASSLSAQSWSTRPIAA